MLFIMSCSVFVFLYKKKIWCITSRNNKLHRLLKKDKHTIFPQCPWIHWLFNEWDFVTYRGEYVKSVWTAFYMTFFLGMRRKRWDFISVNILNDVSCEALALTENTVSINEFLCRYITYLFILILSPNVERCTLETAARNNSTDFF